MICQEETEPDRWVREQDQEEDWADARALRRMDNTLSMESDASAAPDAGACKTVALVVVLRVYILRPRKKKRLNSSAQRYRQGLIKSMVN